jgi:arylsulfatase A-like enzyme
MFGKWHLGYTPVLGPTRQGFARYRGFMGGCLDYHSHLNRSGRPDWWDRALGGDYWSDAKYGSRPVCRAAFIEMVESLDAGVGRVDNALKRHGLERDTLVFY